MELHWSGNAGHFDDKAGNLIAYDPSIQESGPRVLLIRRDRFLEFLEEQDYAVLWVLLGEKNLIGGNIGPDNWKGRLVISGTCTIANGELVSNLSTYFRSPHREPD
jgi:hypothetical protein